MNTVINDYFEKNKKFGEKIVSKLGSGFNGEVYMTDKGYAIKHTKDKAEIKTALKIANNLNGIATPKFKHIKIMDQNNFIIIMEKVTPVSLSYKENNLLNKISEKLINALENNLNIIPYKKAISGNLGSPDFESIISGLIDSLSNLKKIGIINADVHEDNIALKGNKVVLIDVIDKKYI